MNVAEHAEMRRIRRMVARLCTRRPLQDYWGQATYSVREDFAARMIQRPFLRKLRGRAHGAFFDPDGAAGLNPLHQEDVPFFQRALLLTSHKVRGADPPINYVVKMGGGTRPLDIRRQLRKRGFVASLGRGKDTQAMLAALGRQEAAEGAHHGHSGAFNIREIADVAALGSEAARKVSAKLPQRPHRTHAFLFVFFIWLNWFHALYCCSRPLLPALRRQQGQQQGRQVQPPPLVEGALRAKAHCPVRSLGGRMVPANWSPCAFSRRLDVLFGGQHIFSSRCF